VTALETEDPIHLARDEKLDDQLGDRTSAWRCHGASFQLAPVTTAGVPQPCARAGFHASSS
jgi:hypothetical protein